MYIDHDMLVLNSIHSIFNILLFVKRITWLNHFRNW